MNFKPIILPPNDYDSVLKALIEFYNERPDEYGLLERPQSVYEEYASLINKYVPEKASSILDIGSGTWRIPETIGKYGYKEVVGLDFFSDEKLLAFNEKLTLPNVNLKKYDSDRIPFSNQSFNCVASLCVVEHIVFVERMLDEMDRVLKPGGIYVICCPNWSGINVYIMALMHHLKDKSRFWQLESLSESMIGIFRSIYWYLDVLFSRKNKFIMIYPNMKNNKIVFEVPDDDAVHLCQPLSFKKYFKRKGYKLLKYNRFTGNTTYSKFFNLFLPSLATGNIIVAQKNER